MILREVTLPDGRHADVRLRSGLIDSISPPNTLDGQSIDLRGYLLLPAPVEPHAHLDKAFCADRVGNPAGDLAGAVAGWLGYRAAMSDADIRARAREAVRRYVSHGATVIRTHVDIGAGIGLRALEAVCAVRAEVASACDLQVVAFSGNPLSGVEGAVNRDLLREACVAGADVLGACPGFDPEPAWAIDFCLDLAGTHGMPIDLHIDEWLEPEPGTLLMLAEAVIGSGFEPGVVASHCVSLGMMEPDRIGAIAQRVARAGIAVVCLPQTSLYLQGRQQVTATPRGLTAVKALRDAGVTVAAGGDNLQDPFNPLGRADPLENAALMVLAAHHTPGMAYEMVSSQARKALRLTDSSVVVGAPAELLAIRAGSVREAIATATADRIVIHAGRIVARTTLQREMSEELNEGVERSG